MKKFLVLLLSAMLFAGLAYAEEKAVLNETEIEALHSAILKRAIDDKAALESEDGLYFAKGIGYKLYVRENTLSQYSSVAGTVISSESIEVENLVGPKNSYVSQNVDELISFFANDNSDLHGTEQAAALYISGNLPENVYTGVITRQGQSILLVEYTAYVNTAAGVEKMGVMYTIEQGAVVAIRSFAGEMLSLENAENEISEVSKLQEQHSYFAVNTTEPKEVEREDLVFNGLDFVDLTVDDLKASFGEPLGVDTSNDSNGDTFTSYNYEDLNVVFANDNKGNVRAENVVLTGNVEGPRGLRSGENLNVVLKRFPVEAKTLNSETVVLYGDKDKLDVATGLLINEGQRSKLYFRVPVGESLAVIDVSFINDELVEISLGYINK